MAKTQTETDVVISVADSHLAHFENVVKQLRSKGLKVASAMEQIGTISGSITPEKLDALSKVKGVAAVERSQTYQLPPPDSEIQ